MAGKREEVVLGRNPFLPDQSALTLPAGDALRGARAILERTSKALAPIEQHMPAPLGNVAHRLSDGAGDFADRARQLVFDIASALPLDIGRRSESGAAVLAGEPQAAMVARAVRQGMDFCFERFGKERYLVSETLAAGAYWSALRKVRDSDGPAMVAAHLFSSIRRHHIAAIAPGTALGMEDDDFDRVQAAAFAVMLWMLVERSAPQDNEDEILALCADVAASLKGDIEAAASAPRALARLMTSFAEVI